MNFEEVLSKMVKTGLMDFNPVHNTHVCAFSVQTRREIRP